MSKLISKALFYLSKREYSQIELENKLMLYTDNKHEIAETIEHLIKLGYQSDKRYIEAYISSKYKYFGIAKIKYELRKKVKDIHLINDACNTLEINEAEIIRKIIKKKYKIINNQISSRIIRFLYSKGFNIDIIYQVIKSELDN